MTLALRSAALIGMLLAASVAAWRARRRTIRTAPITVVVPFPAGGLTDVPARLAAAMLQEKIGQPLSSRTAPAAPARSAQPMSRAPTPDGYTLLANSLADTQNLHYCRCPTTRWMISRRSAGSSTARRWSWSSTPSCRSRRWPN